MTPAKQLFRHEPEKGIHGDCFRTAVACLLDVEPEAVPHDHRPMVLSREMAAHGWLHERGLMVGSIGIDGTRFSMEEILAWAAETYPGVNLLFSGTSKSGNNHVVIIRDGAIVWDPHPDEVGIVGPCDDGNWFVDFIAKRT